ncbi:hypothetical protein B9Q11_02870 [Candidatus Marsarchaeota G2 archaeon ECH_B_SAG-F08]|uniref:Uncharacterized protein n=3 Tax=Candidatus Marsarchaeota group 2 TaxID=2203771 RepID=A0A2R6BYM6_9ARCH|nr:MAG: hypothetical protein B9Q11_02870 [Candidatus Marsarchaeota G2 archaeon ECH_B_SAG-F08]PSO03723.1 MAG: hypothetical protein B9Q12_03940 [Candidatus Marsarchaeota G2 archaeon ECH_B_SAG-G06]PSO04263.1 MAG: hypothetical protein B9Q13_05100 [Candidatus Marsarchaeota G2 archaeon ECH_B_SAG-G16]
MLFGEVTKQRNIVSPVSVLGDERLKEKVNEVFDKDFRSMPQELSWHEYITSFLIVDSIINKSGLSMEKFLAKLIEIANSIPRGIHDFKSFKH